MISMRNFYRSRRKLKKSCICPKKKRKKKNTRDKFNQLRFLFYYKFTWNWNYSYFQNLRSLTSKLIIDTKNRTSHRLPQHRQRKQGRKEGIKKAETREKRLPSRSISLPKTSSRVSSGSVQVEERRAQGGSSISAKIVEGGWAKNEREKEKRRDEGLEEEEGKEDWQGGTIEVRRTARRRRYCAPHPNAATPLIIVAGALPTPPLANDKYALIPGPRQASVGGGGCKVFRAGNIPC